MINMMLSQDDWIQRSAYIENLGASEFGIGIKCIASSLNRLSLTLVHAHPLLSNFRTDYLLIANKRFLMSLDESELRLLTLFTVSYFTKTEAEEQSTGLKSFVPILMMFLGAALFPIVNFFVWIFLVTPLIASLLLIPLFSNYSGRYLLPWS